MNYATATTEGALIGGPGSADHVYAVIAPVVDLFVLAVNLFGESGGAFNVESDMPLSSLLAGGATDVPNMFIDFRRYHAVEPTDYYTYAEETITPTNTGTLVMAPGAFQSFYVEDDTDARTAFFTMGATGGPLFFTSFAGNQAVVGITGDYIVLVYVATSSDGGDANLTKTGALGVATAHGGLGPSGESYFWRIAHFQAGETVELLLTDIDSSITNCDMHIWPVYLDVATAFHESFF